MFRMTLQQLASRKLRLVTTSIAVLLGVAFMAGTLVLTDTIGRTYDALFADVNRGTDAYVRSDSALATSTTSEQRARLDASLVDTVAHTDGVAAAEGSITAYAQLVGPDGHAIGNPDLGAPTYGGNWLLDDRLNPFDLVAGRAPVADREVVIDKGTAEDAGFAVGDAARILTTSGVQDVAIVGIATFGDADNPAGSSYALFTADAAQRYLSAPGKVDAIKVVAADGVSDDDLVARLSSVVPEHVEVLTGAQITAEDLRVAKQGLGFFTTFLLVFAAIALFVGSFIIYNSFSILVAQRSKEMALLRAIGASRRQVLGAVLVEAVAVGAVASTAGLFVGIGVAWLLRALLPGLDIDVPGGGLAITSRTVVVAIVVGLVVTVASALLPARKASKVAPIAALRDVALDVSGRSVRRLVAGVGVTTVGVAVMAAGLFADAGLALVGLGAAVIFVGVAVLGPVLARPVSRLLGWPLPRLKGMAGTLARENAMRNPKRTSATAAALMIGVALVAFISILASSTKDSIDASLEGSFTGDLVVDSGSLGFGGLSPELARRLNELPEVADAAGLRTTSAEVGGSGTLVLGADLARMADVFDFDVRRGSLADLGPTQIGVLETRAEVDGLDVGDVVPVRFSETGVHELTVGAIYGADPLGAAYLLGLGAYEANVADQFDARVFVNLAPGVDAGVARAAITTLTDDYPVAEVQDRAEFMAAQTAQVDQLLNLIYVLLALAVLIAVLGIANTLALSIFERTRELGLLRAVGMTRRQVRSTVRWESVIIALFGTGLGLVIGIGFARAIVKALNDAALTGQGLGVFTIPVTTLGVVVVIAAIAGVAAAVLPARRAAGLDILDAIATS